MQQAPRADFLEQRVKDLMQYRDFLEEQVAAAKAIISRQAEALKQCPSEAQPTPPTR
jgi:hypothetical protein